jgi:hypothetical protein
MATKSNKPTRGDNQVKNRSYKTTSLFFQQENSLEKIPTERLLKDLIKNLSMAQLYENCILYGEELIRRDSLNGEYCFLLASAYVNRFVSIGLAERLQWQLPLDEKLYQRYIRQWEQDQSDSSSVGDKRPRPIPPVLKTYDDRRPYRMSVKDSKNKRIRLKEQALSLLDNAQELQKTNVQKAVYLHQKCWAQAIFEIIDTLTKQDSYTPDVFLTIPREFALDKSIISDMEKCISWDSNNATYYQSMGDLQSVFGFLGEVEITAKSVITYEKSLQIKKDNPNLYYLLYKKKNPFFSKSNVIADKDLQNLSYYKNNYMYWYDLALRNDKNFLSFLEQGNLCSSGEEIEYYPEVLYLKSSISVIKNLIAVRPVTSSVFLDYIGNSIRTQASLTDKKEHLATVVEDAMEKILTNPEPIYRSTFSSLSNKIVFNVKVGIFSLNKMELGFFIKNLRENKNIDREFIGKETSKNKQILDDLIKEDTKKIYGCLFYSVDKIWVSKGILPIENKSKEK